MKIDAKAGIDNGKTILVKRLTVQNENGSSSTFYLAFKAIRYFILIAN